MHKIEYLPRARQDLSSIIRYIAVNLNAPKAARDLLDRVDTALSRAAEYPNMYKVYSPTQELQNPYHFIPVKNYAVFYVVFEDRIEVRRVLYAKMDLESVDF